MIDLQSCRIQHWQVNKKHVHVNPTIANVFCVDVTFILGLYTSIVVLFGEQGEKGRGILRFQSSAVCDFTISKTEQERRALIDRRTFVQIG